MDVRRLELLLALSRLGSMHAVSEVLGVTTSTVSQQIAALAKEVGTPLLEPDGRRVRLTPAGRRLAGHAVHILAAHEAARADLDPSAEPSGTVRVAGFHTAIRDTLLPVVHRLRQDYPAVRLEIQEQEPPDALTMLERDQVDLALIYDYNLAPAALDPSLEATPLWESSWSLAVPSRSRRTGGTAVDVVAAFAGSDWIVNSRHVADEQVVRTLAALAGFEPHITQRADSLQLVQEMITAGLGVGLMPATYPKTTGISLRRLRNPEPRMRALVLTRKDRTSWPPLSLLRSFLSAHRR
ncbi:DNA-binding transcriptional LysR family regulator [Kribbella sp. VKM Ac-2571]|uniref:LysR family transcriptional regulator n=1 Tax=Kribbella sp. VKM Ac-2571 TaxID=2512222 RepID=UPI00105D1CE6|nr:LysR family transcriptional regulator [Kribbella sp. VKM Ac-2571]TDO58950.1 DNA-binding transcriptional LysR family regulator [Kribbella sp. VKM Ac-2571]